MAITQPQSKPPAGRRLTLIAGDAPDRALAVRRAQEARRRLLPRHERFAHLKRAYD